MKRIKFLINLVVFTLVIVLFSSCVKDTLKTTYTLYKPVLKNKTAVLQSIASSTPQPLNNTGKLFLYGQYLFVNEVNKGVHVIDNANPAKPINKYFISIPGNVDLAVKGNTLYADIYSDMVAIDISNPAAVSVKKLMTNIFPERLYENGFIADSTQYIVDWLKYETVDEKDFFAQQNNGWVRMDFFSSESSFSSFSNTKVAGVSGSMARFTIVDDYLYTVGKSTLSAVNIIQPNNPILENTKSVGWNIETIYPLKNTLFIGGQTGMFIYDISTASNPIAMGSFSHACFRDPVIADDQYAYVTLRAMPDQNDCWGGLSAQRNELDIVTITNLMQPTLLKIYEMEEPMGLSKDGNHLFICDGKGGLKVYDAADVSNLKLLGKITNIKPFDIIAQNGLAIVVANEGIFQYDYTNINKITLLSKIQITK